MNTIAYATAGLLTSSLLLIPSALAQSQESQGQGTKAGSYEAGYQDGMRTAREKYAQEIMERMRERSQTDEEEDEERPADGAHFRLIRGDARLDVRCSSEDSTEKCVEAAIALLDHISMERKEMQAKAKPQPPAPGAPLPPPTPRRE
jgi:hypothetical protein